MSVVEQCVEFLADATKRHHCTVPIYCFMPDHLHVMMWGQSAAADAWRAMVRFKQKSGFWLSQSDRPFHWQKDFYDHILAHPKTGATTYATSPIIRCGPVW